MVLAAAVPEPFLIRRRSTAAVAEAEAFLDEALAAGHEGVTAKALDAPYEAGGRGRAWLKIKPAITLDLVVLAAEWQAHRLAQQLASRCQEPDNRRLRHARQDLQGHDG